MSRLFISHSSQNDEWAIALRDWLVREGWSGADDIFLDLDPERGIAAGQRWASALDDAATRCEAVLFIVSEAWLASKWCGDEFQQASQLNKKLFALLVNDVPLDRLPGNMSAQWQVVRLKGEPAERFVTVHPVTQRPSPVHISQAGLANLKRGLLKAGIGPETFDLQPDSNGPLGWRAPYRGLEALEPEDAAVFFGRDADIVRGMDALRGLAARKPPRLLVILGASGAGKSSFLRAGMWPRLLRDDSQWLPLRAIRAGRGGAIEGSDGLLAVMEDVHRRFEIKANRADLRERLKTPERFIALLRELRQAAAKRALMSGPGTPQAVLCLDQGEEVFAVDAVTASDRLLQLVRAAIDSGDALFVVAMRSDSYGLMQRSKALAGIDQAPLSLGPAPHGEIARIIREPALALRRKAGPEAPIFDAAVIEKLQAEIEGEEDSLPLLAFVMQRLMREHASAKTIGLAELDRTGGVTEAIEQAAGAALVDAGFGQDRIKQRDALRRLFIPRLARIDRESKSAQRRVAKSDVLPSDLAPLARALTERRLLVAKSAARAFDRQEDASTLEVAHEALLRRWQTLADLLAEDRDALLLLDGVISASADWSKSDTGTKQDYLAHRGSRLSDAQTLAGRGEDWAREIAPAQDYLTACLQREDREGEEKEAALRREQGQIARTKRLQRRAGRTLVALGILVVVFFAYSFLQYRANTAKQAQLDSGQANLVAELAIRQLSQMQVDSAVRLATHAASLGAQPATSPNARAASRSVLQISLWQADWSLMLFGHESGLETAAFSPDGARIVTASRDKTARVWDVATGKEIATLRGHESGLETAAFSPDGTRIATASADKTARVWDATTGKEIAVLRGHEALVRVAAFSPDGTRIVTASWDKTARVWDATTGKEIAVLRGHEDPVITASFSRSGTRIVTASWDYTSGVWDAATGEEIVILRGHEDRVVTAEFSPDGERIVTASADKTARVWDAATGKQIALLRGHEGKVWPAAFSPDGKRIITASFDKTARVWDASTGKEIAILRGHENTVRTAAFNSDGTRIITASFDATVRVWDAANGKEIAALRGHESAVNSAAFGPDGRWIVTASDDKSARIWKATTSKEVAILSGHEDHLDTAAFSYDSQRIVTASRDATARVWEATTGKEIAILRGHENTVESAAFSSDGTRIVTASADKTARVWDVATGKEIATLRGHESGLETAAFSPDGTRIATASADKTARVWDATTGKEIAVLRGHEALVRVAAFSPDGTRIVTASWDKTARVWDATTGKEIAVLSDHEDKGQIAAFSSDRTRVVTASGKIARIWDVATGKEVSVLRGHEDNVDTAAFSPNGTRIVTASRKIARAWDVATGKEISVLRGHEDNVNTAAFSPDGTRVVTASYDKTARLWDAATGREIAVLRGHGDKVFTAMFSLDGTRIVTTSYDRTARVWDVHIVTMSTQDLIIDVCTRRLRGLTTLSRDEMRLAGYFDDTLQIDVCARIDRQ